MLPGVGYYRKRVLITILRRKAVVHAQGSLQKHALLSAAAGGTGTSTATEGEMGAWCPAAVCNN